MWRRWTVEEIQFLRNAYPSNRAKTIAIALSRSISAVRTRGEKLGLRSNHNLHKQIDADAFKKYWLTNPTITQYEIGEAFGIGVDVAGRLVRKLGLPHHANFPDGLYTHIEEEDLAYAAGFIDGEGYVGVSNNTNGKISSGDYRPTLSVSNTNRDVLDWFKRVFGGTTALKRYSDIDKWEDIYYWALHSGRLKQLLPMFLPFLKVKKKQAQIIIQAYKDGTFYDHNCLCSEETLRKRMKVYFALKKLNRRGKPFPPPVESSVVMTMPSKRKRQIPSEDTGEDESE